MSGRAAANFVRAAVFVWSLVFALSILFAVLAEKTGSGFTRGANRIEIFLTWQFAAVAVAVVAAVAARLGRSKIAKPVRGLGYLPLAVQVLVGVVLLVVAGIVLLVN